jgi:hypothetical protein
MSQALLFDLLTLSLVLPVKHMKGEGRSEYKELETRLKRAKKLREMKLPVASHGVSGAQMNAA